MKITQHARWGVRFGRTCDFQTGRRGGIRLLAPSEPFFGLSVDVVKQLRGKVDQFAPVGLLQPDGKQRAKVLHSFVPLVEQAHSRLDHLVGGGVLTAVALLPDQGFGVGGGESDTHRIGSLRRPSAAAPVGSNEHVNTSRWSP